MDFLFKIVLPPVASSFKLKKTLKSLAKIIRWFWFKLLSSSKYSSIPVTIFKDNDNILSKPLSLIISKSFAKGVFPVIWKKISSHYLKGSLKRRFSQSKYYHPISIFSKIYMKSMYSRIYYFLCK